jgi:hypothetical protein
MRQRAQPEGRFGVSRLLVTLSCWCMGMDKLFETALADAAYWQDFERLQEFVPALKTAVDIKGLEGGRIHRESRHAGSAPPLVCANRSSTSLTLTRGSMARFKAGRLQSGSSVLESCVLESWRTPSAPTPP